MSFRTVVAGIFVASFTLVGCNFSAGDEVKPAAKLNVNDVVRLCENAMNTELEALSDRKSSPMLLSASISESEITADGFDGKISGTATGKGSLSENFELECKMNGDGGDVKVTLPVKPKTTSTKAKPKPTTTTAKPKSKSNDKDIDRTKVDPEHDKSGERGRDDNLGILYHNSVDWEFLRYPEKVQPGVKIYNVQAQASCSAGFLAREKDKKTLYLITAGHCGKKGDEFAIVNKEGKARKFGTMAASLVDRDAVGAIEGLDIGLIEISDPNLVSPKLPTSYELKGWMSPEKALEGENPICHLGATTGYSCGVPVSIDKDGQFYARGIYDRGDSGGAVFALSKDGAWAVGVASRVSDANKTKGGIMGISDALKGWNLALLG
ncbi:hypothetical protein CKALI_05040 [Corynebacterium kalinowskii]|uniref:Peptidase S1 domain-containing protein n=1 Tax=Corynebacterium kalinowskii TaxID=2675216 RepID=A0A6B8V9V3_9CORY|nr:hypothetical protein [Corynebacterium kalinowskii]QGU01882.1 hypothetical protein CKALI_05040 [Corynebacterium kalinowskii]